MSSVEALFPDSSVNQAMNGRDSGLQRTSLLYPYLQFYSRSNHTPRFFQDTFWLLALKMRRISIGFELVDHLAEFDHLEVNLETTRKCQKKKRLTKNMLGLSQKKSPKKIKSHKKGLKVRGKESSEIDIWFCLVVTGGCVRCVRCVMGRHFIRGCTNVRYTRLLCVVRYIVICLLRNDE